METIPSVLSPYHLIPLLPLLPRIGIAIQYKDLWCRELTQSERNTDPTRTLALGIAELSFAGVVGITVLSDANLLKRLEPAMFYLIVTFLCYFLTLSIQGYKLWLLLDIVSDTVMDIGSVSIIAFIFSFLWVSTYSQEFKVLAVFITAVAWLSDYVARLIFTCRAYSDMRRRT